MQTYAIGIFDAGATRKRTAEEQHGPDLLEELAEATGGRHYRVDDPGKYRQSQSQRNFNRRGKAQNLRSPGLLRAAAVIHTHSDQADHSA